MEEFWIQLLTILTLLTQTCSPSDTTELIRAVGRSMTFHGPKTEGNAALWRFGNVPIVTVVFEDPPRLVFLKEEYKTRFTVSERGRALTISQLRMEDAGTYSVTIDGKKSTFTLQVYKELPEPTVTCEAQNCSGSICSFSLRCSVSGTSFGDVSYTRRGWGGLRDEGSLVLRVDKSSWHNMEPLRCTAVNAVSRRNVTIAIPIPKGLCPGAPSGSSVGIVVIVGVAVVVISLVFLVFLCKSKGYGPACVPRLASELVKSSATDGPDHEGCLQAMRLLGPEPGPASDQHGPGPGLASDQFRPELGQTSSVPEQITAGLGPEQGLAMDQHDQSLDRPWTNPLQSLIRSEASSPRSWERSWTSSEQCLDRPWTRSDWCLDRPRICSDRSLDRPRSSSLRRRNRLWGTSDECLDRPQTSSLWSLDESPTSLDQCLDLPQTSSLWSLDESPTSPDQCLDLPQTSSLWSLDESPTSLDQCPDLPQTSSLWSLDESPTSLDQCLDLPQTSSLWSLDESPTSLDQCPDLPQTSSLWSLDESLTSLDQRLVWSQTTLDECMVLSRTSTDQNQDWPRSSVTCTVPVGPPDGGQTHSNISHGETRRHQPFSSAELYKMRDSNGNFHGKHL